MDDVKFFEIRKKKAKLAGILYVILALAALPDMVRKALFVMNDAAVTSKNILANIVVFRLSILGDIITEIAFLLLALCLYSLLKEVKQSIAQTMLAMVVIAVTMAIFKTGIEIAAIKYFEANDQVHGMLLLEIFEALIIPTTVFFGLWMLPLGYLFVMSGFMPKTLGILLMIGSSGYVIHAVFRIVAPSVSEQAVLLSVVAEVAAILWLLVFGVQHPYKKSIISTKTEEDFHHH
jgi:hypothetical protein